MTHEVAKKILATGGNRIFTTTRYVNNGNDRVRCFIATGIGDMEEVTYLCHKIAGIRWTKAGELSVSVYGSSPSAVVVNAVSLRLYGDAHKLKESRL